MSDSSRPFTFAELWSLAMEDPDFAEGRIDAHEAMRRITGRDVPRATEEEIEAFAVKMFGPQMHAEFASLRAANLKHAREVTMKREPKSVQPLWCTSLPLQQQSVLFLASRGPDGVPKHHPCKDIQRAYRACVFLAGKYGRLLREGEAADNFMSMYHVCAERPERWTDVMHSFFDHIDELPHHYLSHLMHGAEILGYKHPDEIVRRRWNEFYLAMVKDLHLTPETEAEMDERLSDWGRNYWNNLDSD